MIGRSFCFEITLPFWDLKPVDRVISQRGMSPISLGRTVPSRIWSVVSMRVTMRSFLFSLDNIFVLGLFVATLNALIAHKCTVILLHGPLRRISVILFAPFLFVWDILTLLLLHRGLASKSRVLQVLAVFICFVVITCSATFITGYLEMNAELNWGRSLAVHSLLILEQLTDR